MAVKFSNNFSTVLVSSISSSATVIELQSVSGLPTLAAGDHTYLTFDTDTNSPTIEIVKVTAINTTTNEVTVVRGQDNTSASAFAAGTAVELRMCAILLSEFLQQDGDGSNLTDVRAETVEVNVKNVSGGSLAKGTPVHQTGTSGAATFEVVAADASNASVMPAHFVLLETLADQAEGRGLLMGRISGVDTSSFSEGDTIYVAVGGGYTNSAPTGEGNLIQNLGTVTRVDSTNGGGEVMGAGRSNATPNLNNGNIFIGNASNQATTASLSTSVSNLSHYNNANWDTAYGWGDHASAGYQAASTALTTSTTFGGDVSGTYNAIVIADDSHNHVISNVDGLQAALNAKQDASTSLTTSTTFGGDVSGTYNAIVVANDSHTHDGRYYTESEIGTFFAGTTAITGYNKSNWDTAYGWGNHGAVGYLTGNQTITLTGDVSGSGTTSIAVTIADDSHNHVWGNIDGAAVSGLGGPRFTTPSGYIEFGPANTSYAHIYTDRGSFYFNVTALYANGNTMWHAGNDGSGSGLDADLLDGLQLHTGRNNEVNKVVRTDSNGYIQAGWINTPSGAFTSTINKIYASSDDYIRYVTPSTLISNLGIWTSGNDGSGSGLDADLLDGVQATGFMRQLSNASSPNYTTPSSRRVDPNAGNPTNAHHAIVTFGNDGNVTGQLATHFVSGQPYTRGYNTSWSSWRTIWTDGNDGSGSGLDADLLDGQQGSYYQPASTAITTGNIGSQSVSSASNIDGISFRNGNSSNGIGPDYVQENGTGYINSVSLFGQTDGALYSQAYSTAWVHQIFGDYRTGNLAVRGRLNGTWQSWKTVWTSANDGAGSGLDADLLDGLNSSSFLRSDTQATSSASLILANNWGQGTYNGQFVIQGTNPSWETRGTSSQNYGWLHHQDSSGNYTLYSIASYNQNNWTQRFTFNHGDQTFRNGGPSGNVYYHQGNDGSGSGLDADLLDGYDSASYLNKNASSYYQASTWIDFRSAGQAGLYWGPGSASAGWHIYPWRPGSLYLRSGNSSYCEIQLNTNGTSRAHIYADSGNNAGWLGSSGAWRMRLPPSGSFIRYEGSTQYTMWDSGNDGSGSGLDADLLDGSQGSYFDHHAYTSTGNYLGGHYTSGGAEKPNSSALGAGKLKPIMLSGSNVGVSGSWNDVLWMSTYTGGDVKRSTAIISSKYDATSVWVNKANYDSSSWGTSYLFWNSGNDGSGSGLDADLLDGLNSSSFTKTTDDLRDHQYMHLNHSSSGTDPNNTAEAWFLTNSSNGPSSSYYWHVQQWFWASKTTSANRAQLAIQYNGGNDVYSRSRYSSWGSWAKLWSSANDGSGSGLDADTCDGQHLGTTANVTHNQIYANDWFRVNGADGIYWQTYGGGIYMTDGTWVRTYNNKNFYVGGGEIATTGNVTAYYSDERLKDKTGDIENALSKVLSLEGFTYVENDLARELGYTNTKEQVGLSAQRVQAVLPQAVSLAPVDYKTLEDGEIVSKSGENYLTVDYSRLVPLLVESIKELKAEVDDLKAQLKEK